MAVISVVMPVYNVSIPFLKEAIESIYNQTFRDFEFIIIDDGSDGETAAFLTALTDPRIKLLRNEENIGITKSLNIGFAAARGKYIARMDGDDYSYPDRFQKQFAFMESHPDVIVCGQQRYRRIKRFNMEEYKIEMLFLNPGPEHPSAFFNRNKLIQYKLKYNESLRYAQDYGLWYDILQCGKVYLMKDQLIDYRTSPNQISKSHKEEQTACDLITKKKMLLCLLDHVSEHELDLHYHYSKVAIRGLKNTPEVWTWYHTLIKANDQKRIYNRLKFRKYVYKILFLRMFPVVQKVREMAAVLIKK